MLAPLRFRAAALPSRSAAAAAAAAACCNAAGRHRWAAASAAAAAAQNRPRLLSSSFPFGGSGSGDGVPEEQGAAKEGVPYPRVAGVPAGAKAGRGRRDEEDEDGTGASTPSSGGLRCIADVCVVPCGVGPSVSKHVVEAVRVFAPHAMGTNVEGEWDDVMAAIKAATLAVHISGVARITTTLKLGTRLDAARHNIPHKMDRIRQQLRDRAGVPESRRER